MAGHRDLPIVPAVAVPALAGVPIVPAILNEGDADVAREGGGGGSAADIGCMLDLLDARRNHRRAMKRPAADDGGELEPLEKVNKVG